MQRQRSEAMTEAAAAAKQVMARWATESPVPLAVPLGESPGLPPPGGAGLAGQPPPLAPLGGTPRAPAFMAAGAQLAQL